MTSIHSGIPAQPRRTLSYGTQLPAPSRDARVRVLFVDDDPDHRRLFATALGTEFDVVVASGGAEALETAASQGPFSVVVSDMRMPRMNGAELLSTIRQRHPEAARILLTGDADLKSAMLAVNQAYVFRYLTKPCPAEQLLTAVRCAAEEAERTRENAGVVRRLMLTEREKPQHSAVDDPELYVGMVIAGRYMVRGVLGVGGTAAVFRCEDRVLDTEVALKLYASDLEPASQQRIRRELILTRELSHPNIARCYDIGIHQGYPFITMELLSGRDLSHLVATDEMTQPRALDYVIQACAGLDHAHRMRVTHRDIKPENLLLTRDGTVHVMDFGLAKGHTAPAITQPGTFAGTVHYMAPEQIRDFSSVTHLADVYSIGVVAYELLTGQAPFDDVSTTAILAAHLTGTAAPPSTLAPWLHPDLDQIILMALAKDPAERFQSCGALAAALQDVLMSIRPTRDLAPGPPPA